MSLFLLDTNACIKHLAGRSALLESKMSSVGDASMVICSVVAGELFFDASKSNNPSRTWAIAERFVNRFRSCPYDDRAAKHYGVVRSELENSGTMIGHNDLMIAAIALANSLTVVTHNVREFQRVSRLKIVDWEVP